MTSLLKETYLLEITQAPLNIEKSYKFCLDDRSGAVVIFSGTVRNHNELSGTVDTIDYQIWETKSLEILEKITNIAFTKFEDLTKIYIAHRFGKLGLREESVLTAVSSPHRKNAYMASEYLIDTVKQTLPVWKFEYYDGILQPSSDTTVIKSIENLT